MSIIQRSTQAEGPQRNKDLRSKSLDFPSPAPSYIIAGQYANLACVYFYTVRPRGANEPGAFAPSRKKEVVAMAQSKADYPTPDCLAPAAIEAKTEAAGVAKATCLPRRPFCSPCSPARLSLSAACSSRSF